MTARLHRTMIALLCLLAALGIAVALTQMRAIGAAHAENAVPGRVLIAQAAIPDAAPMTAPAIQPATPKPADALHNPVTEPRASWDDVDAARKKAGWPLAVLASLIMLARGLGYAGDRWSQVKVLSPLGGLAGTVIAGAGAVGAAGFDVLADGGSWFAVAVAALGAFFLLLHPNPPKKPA